MLFIMKKICIPFNPFTFSCTVMILSFFGRLVRANSADPDQTAPKGAV